MSTGSGGMGGRLQVSALSDAPMLWAQPIRSSAAPDPQASCLWLLNTARSMATVRGLRREAFGPAPASAVQLTAEPGGMTVAFRNTSWPGRTTTV